MATFNMDIKASDGLTAIDGKIAMFEAALSQSHNTGEARLNAKVSSDRRSSFFKDIWAAMAVATGIDNCTQADVVAWGLRDWSNVDDEDGFALSYPSLLAVQRRAQVVTSTKPPIKLDENEVRRYISLASGVIGTGARQRTIVELDPHNPIAASLTTGPDRRDTFFEFVRGVLRMLEIGALARRSPIRETRARGTILEFLYELHANAYEHGKSPNGVRFLRLQKHQYPDRPKALPHAGEFGELAKYLQSQPNKAANGQFNLIEASVSDFGAGIVDGFLATFAGRSHVTRPRRDLLDALLHEQLSSKASDPNAGLGIREALAAAAAMDAFVSLRTGEFWLTMAGGQTGGTRLVFRNGDFPTVVGTHWQLLLPDRTAPDRAE